MPPTSPADSGDAVQPYLPYSVQAADIIRGAILSGRYRLGQRINEVDLASTLGISRSPLREALRQLAEEGLVRLISGRGAYVASFEAEEIRELQEIRQALDVLAAALAAERATAAELDELERSLEEFTISLQQADGAKEPATAPWSSDFHLGIYRAAHNRKLYEQGRVVHTQLRLARFRSGATAERLVVAHDEHVAILNALRGRDPERARRRMLHHLTQGEQHILTVIDTPVTSRT